MIETEGVADEGSDLWVEKYYMSTSNSSESETFINYREDGRVKMVRITILYCYRGKVGYFSSLQFRHVSYKANYRLSHNVVILDVFRDMRGFDG